MLTQEKRMQDLEISQEQVRLELPKCIDNISAVQEKMETREKRFQDLAISQEQVKMNLKEFIDDVKRISVEEIQENTAVREQIVSHENDLRMLMTVLNSVKSTIAGIQTALYHQKLLTHHYDSRENKDALTRLTKLETQFKNAPKAHCVAGSYSRTGLVPCTLCEIGTYQASAGSTSCKPCEVGTYQASAGSTSCITCGDGTWTATTGNTADTDCKSYCVAGSYSRTGLVPCKLCKNGTYQTSAGSTSCTICGEGTWTATTGSTADTDCKAYCVAGSYSRTGLVPCKLCKNGTYQTSAGSTSCTICGEGTWTATTGSTADTDCKEIGTDCGDISGTRSGVYKIKPQGVEEPFSVYCDMQSEGNGWTVFQRRQDGSVDFYRDWANYETGFGDLMGEFWLEQDKTLSSITHCVLVGRLSVARC
ncbi:hypothetical protein ScPMuIL_011195 [Solemya velum]